MDEYYQAIQHLPKEIYESLRLLPSGRAIHVQEIRIHSGYPILLVEGNHSYPFPQDSSLIVSQAALEECIYALADYSIHSKQETLREGYFTLTGGHRVGVAGEILCQNGKPMGYKHFTSVNIRIARRDSFPLDKQLVNALHGYEQGLLIVGPPGCGKTTILRGIASFLSEMRLKNTIIDSRAEIFAPDCGAEIPPYSDVLSGIPRAQGIEMALRVLSPQVILCDEIGSFEDAEAVSFGTNAGVRFIATMHGSGKNSVKRRPQYLALQKTAAFDCIVYLCGAEQAGSVREIEFFHAP